MSNEGPPNISEESNSNVINLDEYRAAKKRRETEKKRTGGLQRDYDDAQINQQLKKVFLENGLNKIGKEKWNKLKKFLSDEEYPSLNISVQDTKQAKQIKEMGDVELLGYFKRVKEDFWRIFPLTFKTLYEELERRMGREDSESSSE